MTLATWMVTGILIALLTPLVALASLARAAWSALRDRFEARRFPL